MRKPVALSVLAVLLALSGSAAHATVMFVDSLGAAGFGSLGILDDFEVFSPKDVVITVPVSRFGLTYAPVTSCSTDCPGNIVVTSPGYSNFGTPITTTSILSANGNEFFTITPATELHRIGFDVYTINEPGNPLSVLPRFGVNANNVLVSVLTLSGSTTLSLNAPPGNFGFLGIVSDEAILQITWQADRGGLLNTGIDNIRVSDSLVASVPEPTTGLLAALGLGALVWGRRRLA